MWRVWNLSGQHNLVESEDGQTMSEYGIVLLVICVATVAVFGTLSTTVAKLVTSVAGLLP